ncbi:reverse transcriptase domain-containing protein [Tanacetum coccineum]
MTFTTPCQVLEKHKEAEDLAADHLSRFESPHMEVLTEREISDKFSDEHLMELKSKSNNDEPWYADFVNYIVGKIVPPNWTFEKRKRFFLQVKTYLWEEPYAFKVCSDNIMRRCVAGSETLEILAHCPSGPTGGNHSANITAKKVYESGFYWPSVFKDANEYVRRCDACQRSGNISSRNEMPQNNIQVCEVFDVWGLDFMGPFPQSRGNKYILVVVDYVSKWVEAQSLPTNDACVVVKFLRRLFARFGVPKALIMIEGHVFVIPSLKKLYKDMVKISGDLSKKLNNALGAFRTAYKTPTGCTPFRLVYGKACHLPVEIEHKAHWAVKQCNMDLTLASKSRLMQLNELAELRDGAYENTIIDKERTKKWHDSRLRGDKDFKVGDKVLIYNSRLKMYPGKLKSKWSGPNIVKTVYAYGAVEIIDKNRFNFKVNGQRLKKYYEALGWHLEEIHVTWAHLEKKQTRLRTYTKSLKELKDCKTPQRYPDVPTTSRRISLRSIDSRTIDQSAGGKLHDRNAKEFWAQLEDLALYDNESWNDPRDFAKPVKAISLPQYVPSTSDRRLIELKHQVQCLMEAYIAPMQPTQVNKFTTSCEICSGPTTLSSAWKIPSKLLLNMHPRVPTKREVNDTLSNPSKAILVTPTIHHGKVTQTLGLVSNFIASQDARLSKFESDFKQQQSEITNKIDTVLKAITDRIAGALPSDIVKNPKLNVNSTSPVLSAHQPQPATEIRTQQPEEPEKTLEDEFKDLHLNLPVLKVLAHAPMHNAIMDKYLGNSEPFDTLADLGACVNIIPLYLFKKLNIGLLEETNHVFGLADGTKSYPIRIVRDVEVHIGRLKLLTDFYVIDMKKDIETPLLVGRGFLAIANAVIDYRKAKIAVGEGITRSVFGVKGIELGQEKHPIGPY